MGLLDQLARQKLSGDTPGAQGIQAAQLAGLAQAVLGMLGSQQPGQQAGLGGDRVDALARQVGLSPDQGLGALTQLLPPLIDQLTRDGKVRDDSQIGQLGSNLLRGLMKEEDRRWDSSSS